MIRGVRRARPPARDRGRLPDHEHRDRGRRHPPRAARPGPRVDDAVAPADRPHRQGRQGRRARSRPTPIRTRSRRTITGVARRRADALTPLRRSRRTWTASSTTSSPTSTRCAPSQEGAHDRHSKKRNDGVAPHDHVDRSRAHALPAAATSTATNGSLAMQRGELAPPPAAALLGLHARRSRAAVAPCSRLSPTSCTRTRWARCTAASSRRSSTPRWVARCRRRCRPTTAFTTLELKTNYRARDHARRPAASTPKARSCTRADASRPPKHACYDDTGTLYAHATSTCLILRSRQVTTETTPTDHDASTTSPLAVRAIAHRRRRAARRDCSTGSPPTASTSASSRPSSEPSRVGAAVAHRASTTTAGTPWWPSTATRSWPWPATTAGPAPDAGRDRRHGRGRLAAPGRRQAPHARRLAALAATAGYRRRSWRSMLPDNRAALGLLRKLSPDADVRFEGGEYEAIIAAAPHASWTRAASARGRCATVGP